MQFSTLQVSALLFAIAAEAQTTYSIGAATTVSACGGQPVLETCLLSTTAIAQACLSSEYSCLCQKYSDVLTCYLSCPNDSRYAAALALQQTYCNDAAVYGTTTSAAVSKAVSSDSSTATTTGAAGASTTEAGAVKTSSGTGTGTATGSAASTSSTSKSDATNLVVGAGSLLIGVAGFAGAFL